jgi:hypothetical protein
MEALEQGCGIFTTVLNDDLRATRMIVDKIPYGPDDAIDRNP